MCVVPESSAARMGFPCAERMFSGALMLPPSMTETFSFDRAGWRSLSSATVVWWRPTQASARRRASLLGSQSFGMHPHICRGGVVLRGGRKLSLIIGSLAAVAVSVAPFAPRAQAATSDDALRARRAQLVTQLQALLPSRAGASAQLVAAQNAPPTFQN